MRLHWVSCPGLASAGGDPWLAHENAQVENCDFEERRRANMRVVKMASRKKINARLTRPLDRAGIG